MRGTVIISETLLEAIGVLISFILIVLVVQLVFQQQTQVTYQSAFEAVARDISTAIDRAAAASGSLYIQQDLPKGLKVNVSISYKNVIVSSDTISARKSFSGLTNTPPASFINPTTLCIVKTQNDNKVSIVAGSCQCNPKDNICDPVCAAQEICDPACSNSSFGVCNPYCQRYNPNVCDENCYSNYPTGICEAACIQPGVADGICSPDCENVKKGVCDQDCYNQYSNGKTGYCDPDCPPNQNLIKIGNLTVKKADGHCYTGCINSTLIVTGQPVQSEPCKAGNVTNWHCLIISKSSDYTSRNYTDYENEIWSCGAFYTKCAGQLCDENNSLATYYSGNVLCHIMTVNQNMFPQAPVCCCVGNNCQQNTRVGCLTSSGEIYDTNDARCLNSGGSTSNSNPSKRITLVSDGICDQDCNATTNICDPDCPNSPACQNICSKENEKATDGSPCCTGLVACPGDNVCKKVSDPLACCGNGVCEGRPGTPNGWGPGNKTRWETFYTCPKDCTVDPHTKLSSCQSGSFGKSMCYADVLDSQGNWIGFTPVWNDNIFGVCQPEIQKFLDRRNWDINELIKTWTDKVPESWAWDIARYQDACNRMQSASLTVATNENYSSSAARCCGLSGAACDSDAQYSPQCLGVGFCIDHSTAVVSILRTLGVPAKDVYSVFELAKNSAHAWVLLKCDQNEPENRQPTQCQGNWGKWLSIDATNHFVALLEQTQYTTVCLMWNDQGLYAQTEGKIDATSGYAYDPGIPKSSSADPSLCLYDKLCKQPFGIDCVVPS
jgi:hypothetical protein